MSKNEYDDDFFEMLAEQFVEEYGEELKREAEELNSKDIFYNTKELDKKINVSLNKNKGRKQLYTVCSAVAAILLFAFIGAYRNNINAPVSSSPSAAPSAPMEENLIASNGEIIPILFEMPDNFSISAVEQDRGQTIYYLAEENNDDVVMVLEEAETIAYEGLKEIEINGQTAYGISFSEYSLITFRKDNINYTLTCKHDLDTIINLSEKIL